MTTFDDVIKLRVNIARLAQAVGAESEIKVHKLSKQELCKLAAEQPTGWDELAEDTLQKTERFINTLRTIVDTTFDEAAKLIELYDLADDNNHQNND